MSYMERVMSLSFMCLFLRVTLVFDLVLKVSANSEVDALAAFKSSISDPSDVLNSWDTTLVTPCTWYHISCNNEYSVIRVELGNSKLSGPLAPQLGQLQSLQFLELYNNNITGTIPDDFGNLTNLLSLDLYMNKLTGPIPEKLANLKKLRYLRLNHNSLSGNIPAGLTSVELQVLDLSNNNLTGNVPFDGSFSAFTPMSFINNKFLNQPNPPPPAVTSQQYPSGKASRPIGVIAGGVAVGAALMFAAPVIAFVYWQRREPPDDFYDVPAEEDPEIHLGQLKRFSLRDLLVATDNFSNTQMLGKGGFGKVYKGRLRNGEEVAVKRLNPERIQGDDKQFQTEVEMISMAVHKNLLRLHGFCTTSTERLLVYPFMQNGSVESCLRERAESQKPLEWSVRRHIALGAAKGLDYLHDHCNPKIIHRDIKAANILLDKNFEAVVGDFGLAKHMDYKKSHVTTAVRGTIGHIAPEYLSTGRSSEKTDVFGYGVMLIELVTGQRAFDLARLAMDEDVYLLEWVRTVLKEKKLETLVDASLQGNYDSDEVEEVIRVALLCTQSDPFERPKMSEVVRMLEGEGFAEKWNQWWNREDTIQQNFNPVNMRNPYWKFDTPSTSTTNNVLPDELSGPR